MLTKRIIPCLDIKDGRTVKGVNFEQIRDAGDPVELAALYASQGADELVFLDITATVEQRKTLSALVHKIAHRINIPFTVGGGIKTGLPISDIVRENEKQLHTEQALEEGLDRLWKTMLDCIFKGVHANGILPGGLQVHRRASDLNVKLLKQENDADKTGTESNIVVNDEVTKNIEQWMQQIQSGGGDFSYILDWVSCFALAVNEENASFGRVVTAPTNGAAGVIPAVLMYAINFCNKGSQEDIHKFLLTANAIGILFKNGATISAAMGGCQAEIGVSSAMAAATFK